MKKRQCEREREDRSFVQTHTKREREQSIEMNSKKRKKLIRSSVDLLYNKPRSIKEFISSTISLTIARCDVDVGLKTYSRNCKFERQL